MLLNDCFLLLKTCEESAEWQLFASRIGLGRGGAHNLSTSTGCTVSKRSEDQVGWLQEPRDRARHKWWCVCLKHFLGPVMDLPLESPQQPVGPTQEDLPMTSPRVNLFLQWNDHLPPSFWPNISGSTVSVSLILPQTSDWEKHIFLS